MAKRYAEKDLQEIDEAFRQLVEGQAYVYLVADPALSFRRSIFNSLQKAGCEEVLEAKDGIDALAQAQKQKKTVVCMAELNLPKADGLQLTQKLRALPGQEQSVVILMSAETRKERIIAAIKSGANGYLKKPFEPQVLLDKLKSINAL